VRHIGHAGSGFAFDCETPRHRQFVEDFQLADRLVSNREYLSFIADGGYARSELWLSDGWAHIRQHGWNAPLYWHREDGAWCEMTLGGCSHWIWKHRSATSASMKPTLMRAGPAPGCRREAEWEVAATDQPRRGNFLESDHLQPVSASVPHEGPAQLFGDVWEWTASAYRPYPGFHPLEGSLGEYNGKFMSGQMVLRGGCCATPESHIRATYRNFFQPAMRWQFAGLRLAREL
jgi:formylglycine-generating enzyme required for sulfatase activity